MGELYLAEDTRLGRRVALKFLDPAHQSEPHWRARFVDEARAAAAIDHPYVCKVYEAGEADEIAFIAMEYIEGASLADRLRSGALPPAEAVHLAREMAEALAKAHDCGVLHRDLKPSNVMLTADNHVKVVDFGLAKRLALAQDDLTAATTAGVVVGTLAYMSPEQVRGQALDSRSDLFSLGVVLYQMLTGTHPFQRQAALETASAILTDTPMPITRANPRCPEELQAIVGRLLNKDRNDRYATARDVARDLLASVKPSAATATPMPSAVNASRFAASIAVLPLINRSHDPEDEYFSDGLTEEIIIRLSRIGGLRVISFRTAMRFRNSDKEITEIGRELGVEVVLEGTVARSGSRVRVRTALEEATSQTQLWGESYEGEMNDVFTIQSRIADDAARALIARFPTLTPRPASSHVPAVELEAYNLYLKGWHSATRVTPQAFQQAWRYFQKSLEVDPTYARTYAAMAMTYARAGNYGFLPDAFPRALAAARKAIELDPNLAEAHTAIGLVAMYYEWDWPAAERSFRRALELDPNFADAHMFFSICLTFVLDRPEDGLREARRAVELDPLSTLAGSNLAWVMVFVGETEGALEQINRTLAVDPDYLPAKAMQANIYWYLERYDDGNRILELYSWTRAHLAWGYAMAGRTDQARTILEELATAERPSAFDLGVLCLFLGALDNALQWLERAWSERENKLCLLRSLLNRNKFLRPYAADPRVQDFLARISPRSSGSGAAHHPPARPANAGL
jgi:serine/threonine protein kinase/tetratricopeptide (TPR) repeat protein